MELMVAVVKVSLSVELFVSAVKLLPAVELLSAVELVMATEIVVFVVSATVVSVEVLLTVIVISLKLPSISSPVTAPVAGFRTGDTGSEKYQGDQSSVGESLHCFDFRVVGISLIRLCHTIRNAGGTRVLQNPSRIFDERQQIDGASGISPAIGALTADSVISVGIAQTGINFRRISRTGTRIRKQRWREHTQ